MLDKFTYLFLVDVVSLVTQQNYKSYNEKEPGYGPCQLQAYLQAFSYPQDGKITHELIQAIHQQAMAFNPSKLPGQYKKLSNHFEIAKADAFDLKTKRLVIAPAYSADDEGIKEFLAYWMINKKDSFHHLGVSLDDDFTKPFGSFNQDPTNPKRLLCVKSTVDIQSVDLETAVRYLFELQKDRQYKTVLSSMPHLKDSLVHPVTIREVQKIMDEFNKEIKLVLTDDDKLTCIVRHVQHLNQLHPFLDGNIRTCYILLNKLLRDYGFPLTILLNPNRLDCCSLKHLVGQVKQGQIFFQQLLQHKEGDLILVTEESIEMLKRITCTPQSLFDIKKELVDLFIQQVTGVPRVQCSIGGNPHSLFAVAAASSTEKDFSAQLRLLIAGKPDFSPIQEAVDAGKFGVGFRRACAHGTLDVISKFVEHIEQLALDINEQSTNGNTALDWLAKNKNLDSFAKESLKVDLLGQSSQGKIIK